MRMFGLGSINCGFGLFFFLICPKFQSVVVSKFTICCSPKTETSWVRNPIDLNQLEGTE